MSDLTLEILRNKDKYPDATTITLASGETITAKELRDALQPRAEFTRASEAWSRKERELQGAVDSVTQQLAAALEDKRTRDAAAGKPPADGNAVTREQLEADPVLGPMFKELREAKERVDAHETRLKAHEDQWIRDRYTGQLGSIAARHNAKFKDKPFDQKAFLDFAVESNTPNLDVAYKAWIADDLVALERKDAEEKGVERGKAAARVPTVPFGRRRTPARPQGLPESLQDLKDEDVLNDPEMQEAMRPAEE
jgi:hypothetical protein